MKKKYLLGGAVPVAHSQVTQFVHFVPFGANIGPVTLDLRENTFRLHKPDFRPRP